MGEETYDQRESIEAAERTAWLASLDVGATVAWRHSHYDPPSIHKIVRVTPTGRMICERIEVNPDGRIRGEHYARIIPATTEISEEIETRWLVSKLRNADWKAVPLDVLRAVNACLTPPAPKPAGETVCTPADIDATRVRKAVTHGS